MSDRFLIIRLSSFGDIIHTLPAFAALRRRYPEGTIRWAVEGGGEEVLELVVGLDEIVVIDWTKLGQSVVRLRGKDQVALDFQGLIKSGWLARLSRAQERVGFSKKNLREPLASLFYTRRVDYIEESKTHVIRKNIHLLRAVGVELGTEDYEFPLHLPGELLASVFSRISAIGFSTDKRLLVYNLGAAWETKRWFPEKWAELIDRTRFEDAFPLLLWGNERERELALKVSQKTGLPLSPFLTVREVIALIKLAGLVISGDTFALQVAAALRTPVVGLFGPTSPVRNGPFRPGDRVIYHEVDCNPCYKRTCRTLDCLRAIPVEEVGQAVEEAWKKR